MQMKKSENSEKLEKSKRAKTIFSSLIVVLGIFIFTSLLQIFGVFEKFEFKFYDLLLGLKKQNVEREELLLVDIDDLALDKMGDWPWTRDKIADALIYMKELGAETVVFDIEYLSSSQKSVDTNLYEKMLKDGFATSQEIQNLFVDNDDYFARSIQFFGNSYLTINAGDLAIDYSEEELSYSKKRFLFNAEDSKNQLEKKHLAKSDLEFSPSVFKFISRAKGAGFTNVKIDSDGTRRRIPLFIKYEDGLLAQLSFSPILKILNPQNIKITKHYIILENCKLVSADTTDASSINQTIKIPIDKDGTMLINWLKKPFAQTKILSYDDGTSEEIIDGENTSFKHCSVFYLWNLGELEKSILSELEEFKAKNSETYNPEDGVVISRHSELALGEPAEPAELATENTRHSELGSESVNNEILVLLANQNLQEKISLLLENYSEISEYKNFILSAMNGFDENGNAIGGNVEDEIFDEYFALRKNFFASLTDFSNSEDFINFINEKPELYELAENFCVNIESFNFYFEEMQKMFAQKFCILGNTGSGTTDLGSTPFQNSYPNVGTHANVYNTIMTQDFITQISWIWAALLTAILTFFAFAFHSNLKVWVQSVWALALLSVVICVPIILMRYFGLYVPLTPSILIVILSYILITAFRFRSSEKDKKFITGAFSQCLSKDVVDEIIKDPSKLVLGGKNYDMTAIFTDIQKFSAFSELLSAEELVALLNYYLTQMSEIIIGEKGTIDKYEGDAIVAFVGAPVAMTDHASRACSAAIKMKRAEAKINQEIFKIAAQEEKPADISATLFSAFKIMVKNNRKIFTRIGLNSGEIVAGFMGSDNKKNYTVMGNNVNLASRLEGVNKQYSTSGILMSDATRKQLNENFIVRSLDRVQVVNVKTPIRLYELLGFKSEFNEKLLSYLDDWENAIKLFEDEKYFDALKSFKKLSEQNSKDKVCLYYISLLEKFFVQGKYPTAKDDFGVAFNAENPSDMDKSWIGTEKEIKGTFTLLQK